MSNQINIKGNMIPKVLKLLKEKAYARQPILSFHSSQDVDAPVYVLNCEDLIDYIESISRKTSEKFAERLKDRLEERCNRIYETRDEELLEGYELRECHNAIAETLKEIPEDIYSHNEGS